MRKYFQKMFTIILVFSLMMGCIGCSDEKKEPKPRPKVTAKIDEGNANADGKGEGQADVPLIIGCSGFSRQFNPFLASGQADRQVVDLTQVYLVTNDRAGRIVYKGIDGELRKYNGKNYTYYGATDLSVKYDKKSDTSVYRIKLRDDLLFSDGEKLTIDDVIFSIYVLCDSDYKGSAILKNMPIQGLTNYLADSTKAEKLSEKKVKQYIKKHYHKLSKHFNKQDKYFDIQMERQARIALSGKKGKKVKNISGIRKINDYEMSITTSGYNREMTTALKIPICALHYYGDTEKFDIGKNQFGFVRGNISSILANKTNPVGAGAYRFIKCENDVIYFNSNELYYLGCPEIAFLQMKDMTETLQETNLEIKKKQMEELQQQQQEEKPHPSICPVAEIMEVTEGTADALNASFPEEELPWIMGANSNNKFSGNTLDTRFVGDGQYHYIGINASRVAIGKDAGSNASKYLRKALASVFSDARSALLQEEGANVRLVNYPVAAESWLSPNPEEEQYAAAYSRDIRGDKVYDSSEEAGSDRTALVKKMALEYLQAAGYQVQQGKVVAAPEGALSEFTIWVADGQKNRLYPVVEKAVQILGDMGITLKMESINGTGALQKKLQSGMQQLWVASRAVNDMDMQARYAAKNNPFGIKDKVLNRTIRELDRLMSSSERKERYQRCFEHIMDGAVEVPVCEYYTITLYSSKRIDMDTIAKDVTVYYSWMNEMQKVRME